MKVFRLGQKNKPNNFSRKGVICSCLTPIIELDGSGRPKIIEKKIIKYSVEPNKNLNRDLISPIKIRKNLWTTWQYWGEFNNIVELPPVFSKLDEKDYDIEIATFTRDNIQMPFIFNIIIKNSSKYNNLKLKEERKKKLFNLKYI
jgi:hypothetical protein